MTEIKIIPIFNQKDADIMRDFVKIKTATMTAEQHRATTSAEVSRQMLQDVNSHRPQFTFGAYAGDRMVGFIHGDAYGRCATIQSLYVLPKWQGKRLGHRLLNNVELAMSLSCAKIELISLAGAMGFYRRHGYGAPFGSNIYVKSGLTLPRCESVPVFYCPKALAGKIQRINPNFDAAYVNVQHRPLFAYYNLDGMIVGYATHAGMFTLLGWKSNVVVSSSLQRKIEYCR